MPYQLVTVAAAVVLLTRRLRPGRASPREAAAVAAAVAPALVQAIPLAHLPTLFLMVAALYMIFREAVESAEHGHARRR